MQAVLAVLFSFLFMAPSWVWAAIDCADANAVELHENSPGTSESIAYTTPSGSDLITFLGIGGRKTTTPVESNVQIGGQAMTVIGTTVTSTSTFNKLYYKVNPPAGTNNVTFDLDFGPTNGSYIIWTCTGVDTADPFRSTPVTASGTDTTPTVDVTTVNTGDMIVDYFLSDNSATPSVGSAQTVIHEGITGSSNGGASWQHGADGVTMSWTIGASDDWTIRAAPLKPSAAAAAFGPLRRRH